MNIKEERRKLLEDPHFLRDVLQFTLETLQHDQQALQFWLRGQMLLSPFAFAGIGITISIMIRNSILPGFTWEFAVYVSSMILFLASISCLYASLRDGRDFIYQVRQLREVYFYQYLNVCYDHLDEGFLSLEMIKAGQGMDKFFTGTAFDNNRTIVEDSYHKFNYFDYTRIQIRDKAKELITNRLSAEFSISGWRLWQFLTFSIGMLLVLTGLRIS